MSEVQGEIEKIQGRMRFLQNQIALSTIHVEFLEKGLAAVERPGPFSPVRTVQAAWYAFLVLLRGLFTVIVWAVLLGAVVCVPLLIILAVRRRRQRKAPPQPEPPA